jgi:hypothetical protein
MRPRRRSESVMGPDRMRRMSIRSNRGRKALLLSSGVCAAILVTTIIVLLPDAQSSDPRSLSQASDLRSSPKASDPIPDYAIKLAGGRIGRHSTWGVLLFGRSGGNCWANKTTTHSTPFEEVYCGYPVPPAYWRLISSGQISRDGAPGSMLFFLTRRDVGRITALVDPGKGQPNKWVGAKTQVISPGQARRSHARSNFSYAVARFPGTLFCIKQVAVFDRSDQQVDQEQLTCTGPRDPIKENFE